MAELRFDTELHTKYWKRCLKAVLPTGYTSNDSSRMTLGFFTLCALDILDQQKTLLSKKERVDIRDWILSCQHPNGGFCGSTNHRFPDAYYADVGHGKQLMDPANLPATFFAILSLTFVGNLNQVRRRDCLKWLKSLQRDDGSFGELVTADGNIQGGRDMRYCYVASVIRWMLGGDQLSTEEDINVDKLVDHLRNGQTYDGGISESSQHESHAGYTYCAIASLHFLGRLPEAPEISYADPNPSSHLLNIPDMIHWLVSRQVGYNAEEEEEREGEEEESPTGSQSEDQTPSADPLSLETLSLQHSECVGFNGRCNKPVDTCYAFWVGASLTIIGQGHLIDPAPIRRFLFEETQHRIGGFGKHPGDPPDIYHSCLALAILAIWKEPGLKTFDPALCVSTEHREKVSAQRAAALIPSHTYWKHGYGFSVREDDPDFAKKMAESEDPPQGVVVDTSRAIKT